MQGGVRPKCHVCPLRRQAKHVAAVIEGWAVYQAQATVDRRQLRLLDYLVDGLRPCVWRIRHKPLLALVADALPSHAAVERIGDCNLLRYGARRREGPL